MNNGNTRSKPPAQLAQPPVYIGRLEQSAIGPLWVAVSECGLVIVDWNMPQAEFSRLVEQRMHQAPVYDLAHTAEPLRQLKAYLAGDLREFSLPLDLSRQTAFQQQVLWLTSEIPYGQTCTYKDLARRAGTPHAARAVGRVEATNPLPLVIPCHRVVGTDGSLHGYGGPGGVELKAWLLQLEQAGLKKITAGELPAA